MVGGEGGGLGGRSPPQRGRGQSPLPQQGAILYFNNSNTGGSMFQEVPYSRKFHHHTLAALRAGDSGLAIFPSTRKVKPREIATFK